MHSPEVLPQDHLRVVRETLAKTYQEIEQRAVALIRSGGTVDNSYLNGKPDSRYSLVVVGLFTGASDAFLHRAGETIREVEPDICLVLDGFRHIALREMQFAPHGRWTLGMDAETASAYYEALTHVHVGEPVRLKLARIFPAIDKEQQSVSIVGAFMPVDSLRILDVRSEIKTCIEDAGLQLGGRLGDIPVLFSTIGRLPHPVKRESNHVPLLSCMADLNAQIPEHCQAVIDAMDVLSTTRISYMAIDKHVYMAPAISLVHPNDRTTPYFLSAHQRKTSKKIE